jgi:hypothetical protein
MLICVAADMRDEIDQEASNVLVGLVSVIKVYALESHAYQE